MNISINQVNHAAYTTSAAISKSTSTPADTKDEQSAAVQKQPNVDTYVPSAEAEAVTNGETSARPNKLSAQQIKEMEYQVKLSMQNMVKQMLGQQIKHSQGIDYAQLAESLGIGTTPEAAAQAISEDGMWGVDAVATRLMDMALSLSGGDSSKAELLREAVQKGFEAVGALDSLPQVCQDTYAEVMKRFDYWQENGTMDGYGKGAEATEE